VERQCSRPACAELAAATLTYHYERGTAWLDVLVPERDPHAYDLCQRHADRVGVPVGWRFEDRRALLVVVAAIEAPAAPPEPREPATGPVPMELPAPRPEHAVPGLPHRLAG
jgi:hypothetical protein